MFNSAICIAVREKLGAVLLVVVQPLFRYKRKIASTLIFYSDCILVIVVYFFRISSGKSDLYSSCVLESLPVDTGYNRTASSCLLFQFQRYCR